MSIPKRLFGKNGPEVSALGFGCMRLPLTGTKFSEIDVPLAVSMIRRAIDSGVNYFDTAYVYHSDSPIEPGESEPVLYKALADGYRDKVLVASKLPLWAVKTRADMDRILDDQVRRLGGPLDVYLTHNVSEGVWNRMTGLGILSFFDDALKDGRIRRAGFSFHDHYAFFEEVLNAYDWSMTQIQYNYLDVEHQAGRRGLRLAAERGIGVAVMEPLRGGFLVNRLPAEAVELLRAARPEWSFAEWALRWVLDQPEVSVVLSGMSAMDQVTENLRIAETAGAGNFTENDRDTLRRVREIFLQRIKVGCTACGYCLPCPNGVAIPRILASYNEFHYSDDPETQATVRFYYSGTLGDDQPATACNGCGACVEKCPQHIDIPAAMSEAVKLFH